MFGFIEDILMFILQFIGVEITKNALGSLFSTLGVAVFGWIILTIVFIFPVHMIIKDNGKRNETREKLESGLAGLAFIISFGGCLYLWSIGF